MSFCCFPSLYSSGTLPFKLFLMGSVGKTPPFLNHLLFHQSFDSFFGPRPWFPFLSRLPLISQTVPPRVFFMNHPSSCRHSTGPPANYLHVPSFLWASPPPPSFARKPSLFLLPHPWGCNVPQKTYGFVLPLVLIMVPLRGCLSRANPPFFR